MAEKDGDTKKILQECVRNLMSVSEQLDKKVQETPSKSNQGKVPSDSLDLRLDAIREHTRLFNFKPISNTILF